MRLRMSLTETDKHPHGVSVDLERTGPALYIARCDVCLILSEKEPRVGIAGGHIVVDHVMLYRMSLFVTTGHISHHI